MVTAPLVHMGKGFGAMRFGFRNLHFRNRDWKGLFDFSREIGAESIQPDGIRREDIVVLRELMAATGIRISSVNAMSLKMLGPDRQAAELDRRRVVEAIDIAHELGVTRVSQFAGNDPARSFDENIEEFSKVFGPLADCAEGAGVMLVIENCPMVEGHPQAVRNLAYCPAAWEAMFQAVPSTALGLELDTGHLPGLGIEVETALRDFYPRVGHIHLKDVRVQRERLQRHGWMDRQCAEFCPMGEGDIDFPGLFQLLRELGYQGDVTLDLRPTDEEALRHAAAYVRNALGQRIAGS